MSYHLKTHHCRGVGVGGGHHDYVAVCFLCVSWCKMAYVSERVADMFMRLSWHQLRNWVFFWVKVNFNVANKQQIFNAERRGEFNPLKWFIHFPYNRTLNVNFSPWILKNIKFQSEKQKRPAPTKLKTCRKYARSDKIHLNDHNFGITHKHRFIQPGNNKDSGGVCVWGAHFLNWIWICSGLFEL